MKTTEKAPKALDSNKVEPKAKTTPTTTKTPVTVSPTPKPTPKVKTAAFTRMEAVGIVMKSYPTAEPSVIISKADALYHTKTGAILNPKETKWQLTHATQFLKGYNSK
ncbi:MAG TPA: hypothetical protein VIK10_06225 [Prolixibacteraceae bacterium]